MGDPITDFELVYSVEDDRIGYAPETFRGTFLEVLGYVEDKVDNASIPFVSGIIEDLRTGETVHWDRWRRGSKLVWSYTPSGTRAIVTF